MELFRALAMLAEFSESAEFARVASALELGALPSASEHTELFVFQLYPYASVYLGAEGMLGGEARDRVAGFWRALGATPPAEVDHLSVMLAFYARLVELAEDANGDAGNERDAARRGGRRRARKAFLWEHLLSWLPAYLTKLREIAPPFYRRWSEMLMEALLEEAETSGRPELPPAHLRAATGLTDPRRDDDAGEFLDSLLSPVRSGMILTRSDMSRAARRMDAGLRLGERRFILKTLLGQDARGTLAWLAEEAASWVERHHRQAAALGDVAGMWEAKAAAAAALLHELQTEAGEVMRA